MNELIRLRMRTNLDLRNMGPVICQLDRLWMRNVREASRRQWLEDPYRRNFLGRQPHIVEDWKSSFLLSEEDGG